MHKAVCRHADPWHTRPAELQQRWATDSARATPAGIDGFPDSSTTSLPRSSRSHGPHLDSHLCQLPRPWRRALVPKKIKVPNRTEPCRLRVCQHKPGNVKHNGNSWLLVDHQDYCIILLHLHIWIRSVFVLCGLGSTLCLWWPQLQRATSPLLLLYHITATLVAQQQLGSLGVAHVAHIPGGTITLQTSHLGIGDNDNWQQVAVRPSHRCRGSRRAWQGSRAQGNPDGWQRRLLETPAKSKSQIYTYQIKLHSCISYI